MVNGRVGDNLSEGGQACYNEREASHVTILAVGKANGHGELGTDKALNWSCHNDSGSE